MGLLDWFRRRKNPLGIKKPKEEEAPPVDKEKKAYDRTGKLRTEIEEHIEEKPKRKRKRKKESV